jgi:DNA-binding CsgD family transcriptional regulator
VALGMYSCLSARLHNSYGQYDKALTDARRASERDDIITCGWALAERVEAGVRAGGRDEAVEAFDRLSERTRACGTQWALGVEARCRGLLNDDEASYRESTERLAQSRAALDLARSQLCYGEWLRRVNRRSDAREPLRAAHESFGRMGATAFAERARRELLATGETVRKRTGKPVEALTPQEVHVAMMARDGNSNPEIGARLFISPRTVEYHLHKVFRKLRIASRRELRDALPQTGQV